MTGHPAPPRPVSIRQEDPIQPEIVALLRNGEANSAALYPAESNHHLGLDDLRKENVRFLVARDIDDRAVATGALVSYGDWAEIKRMWVEDHARGRGISRQVLDALIDEARRAGIRILRLETGVVSHAALALYETAGFERRGPFADYADDPLSVFMERCL